MTVKELIKALGQMPQDASIEVSGPFLNDFDYWETASFSQVVEIENHENYVEITME